MLGNAQDSVKDILAILLAGAFLMIDTGGWESNNPTVNSRDLVSLRIANTNECVLKLFKSVSCKNH